MRGAVPAPNENPCMPCRSLDAHKANTAIAISAIPPTKSCGPRTHFGMIDLTGAWLGVSLIYLSPRAGLLAHSVYFAYHAGHAGPTVLPTDFRQITPAKPKQPPASNSHSGFNRVAKASTAATAVTTAPAQVRSAANAKIRPLAPINPIESGTRAA